MKRLALLIGLLLMAPRAFAASGCTYPTTLDSFVDKIAGDFLTIADVNARSCAVEKLETGPLRPNDGSLSAPAYAFRGSASTGMFLISGPGIGWSANGTERMRITGAGALLVGNTAATGVGAEDLVLDNARFLKWVNVGQTTAANIYIVGNTSDELVLGTSATDRVNIAANGAVRIGNVASTGVNSQDLVIQNNKAIRWVNNAGTTAGEHYISATNGNHMFFGVTNADGQHYEYQWGGVSYFAVTREHLGAGILFMTESSADHSAPAANQAVIYSKDNGAGKTQLCAVFSSGAPQCFATQP